MTVTLDSTGLFVDDQFQPLWSAELRYWQHTPAAWPARLDEIVAAGLRLVELPLPWAAHATADGTCDFAAPRNDLATLIRLTQTRNLRIIIRPGPLLDAGLPAYGLPLQLFDDAAVTGGATTTGAAMAAWGPDNRPLRRTPSLASEEFWNRAADWLRSVLAVLAPHLHPRGPIIAARLDGAIHQAADPRGYRLDYRPEMLVAFRRWLEHRHGSLAALTSAWRRPLGSFDEVDPPRTLQASLREDLPPYLDWFAFLEDHRQDALRQTVDSYRHLGLGDLPVIISDPANSLRLAPPADGAARTTDAITVDATQVKVAAAAAAPLASINGPAAWPHYKLIRRVCRSLPADQLAAPVPSTAAPAQVTVVGQGETVRLGLLAAVMHGATAVTFAFDADVAGPPSSPGQVSPGETHPAAAPPWMAEICQLAHELELPRWQQDHKVLLLYPHLYRHMELATAGDARPFGFGRPIQSEGPALLTKFIDLAACVKLALTVGDTRMPLEEIRQYPVVLCATLEMLSAEVMRKLADYVAGGGFLAIGPRIPVVDEYLRSDQTLSRHFGGNLSEFGIEMFAHGNGRFFTLPGHVSPETIVTLTFESGMARGLLAQSEFLDSAVLRRGHRRIMAVANPMASVVETTFSGEFFRGFRDLLTLWQTAASRDEPLPIPPRSVNLWGII